MRQVITLAAALGAMFAGWQLAQSQEVVPAQPRQVVPAQPGQPAPQQQGAVDPSQQVGASDFYKASELIGMNVQGADGQTIGTVKDLLIDARSEQVRYMVLDSGATVQTDAGGGMLVVPSSIAHVNYFAEQPDQRFIRIDFDQQRLSQAPRLPSIEVRGLRNPQWTVDVDKFYNVRRSARPELERPVRERREGIRERREELRNTPPQTVPQGEQPQPGNNN